MCFVVTCWERADLLALVCGVFCEFVTFPLVSWVRCGTWLYRFLIFATLLLWNNYGQLGPKPARPTWNSAQVYKTTRPIYFLKYVQVGCNQNVCAFAYMYIDVTISHGGSGQFGFRGFAWTPYMPPFLDILWKWNNLVSNYIIFMGNLKFMTRAGVPRNVRACMFLTLSLYMIMHVSINMYVF